MVFRKPLAHARRATQYFEHIIVAAMVALAIFVQIFVYGATKIRSHGALLEDLKPYFGAPFAIAFVGFQAWYYYACRPLRMRHLLVALFLVLALVAFGRRLPWGESLALAAGLCALVLAAGRYTAFSRKL
jgi:hypothetical protein